MSSLSSCEVPGFILLEYMHLFFWQWLVTKKAYEQWEKYKLMLSRAIPTADRNGLTDALLMNGIDEESREDVVLDTVGAV